MWGSLALHHGPVVTEPPALLQQEVCAGQYGPGMAELEERIAELNILQNEINDQGEQLRSLVGPAPWVSREDVTSGASPSPCFSSQSRS